MASSRIQTISGTTTIPPEEGYYLIDNTVNAASITMPDATVMCGKQIGIALKATVLVTNTVSLLPVGSQKIAGVLTTVSITTISGKYYFSDGNNWY